MQMTKPQPVTLDEYTGWLEEIEQQPKWRAQADKEADYADGNQLDSALLQRQAQIGIPPAQEDLISQTILSIQGYEAATRTDFRVTSEGGMQNQDLADAINFKLNQAERHSKADRACSEAFRSQIVTGIGWVEVRQESDPGKFHIRCQSVHRNEIHWDTMSREDDLSDARFLRRQRWMHASRAAVAFPKHRELIEQIGRNGAGWWNQFGVEEGGQSTGLRNSWNEARSWTIPEDRWYNQTTKQVCITELWYRRWVEVVTVRTPDGRTSEYDPQNLAHVVALASGVTQPEKAIVGKVRRAYFVGPHMLDDGDSPYPHCHFPYVPFWGFREDMTGVPYGYVRGMIYQQDALNATSAKLRWGMASVRTERTKGAVDMTDEQFRRQVSRIDADIVLNAEQMARPGARFEVKRDFALNAQHLQMMNDARQAILRVSAVTAGFLGKQGTATSGLQEQTQVEQSNQALGRIMDNFRAARSQVGELLMAMVIDEIGDEQTEIIIDGDALRPDKSVMLNQPMRDDEAGYEYKANDLLRARLKVALQEVPSTASYRGQQLNAMSEAIKSLPANYQAAALPYMLELMDIPNKRDVIESMRKAGEQETPEQIEQRIQQAVADALAKAGNEIKARELDIKERKTQAEIDEITKRAVQIGVQTAFSAMQAGAQVATMPQIAPIADAVMQGAGYQLPAPAGQDPNFPAPAGIPVTAQQPAMLDVRQNTSPAFPPIPQDGASPMQGIETPSPADNI